jgi:AcrR family transcriptional regulator
MTVRNSASGGTVAAGRRQRNARGQGARLSEEIVSAALELICRTGTKESVTLRAVAREIGIAAPSIYPHFADRDAILMAVVARLFDELTEAITAGTEAGGEDPVDRLVAGCEGYVRYGMANPARYGALFSSQQPPACSQPLSEPGARHGRVGTESARRAVPELGAQAFALVVEAISACIDAGASSSRDAAADGTAVWVALHGTVTLRTARPAFPWPEPVDEFVRQLVLTLARITNPAPRAA